MENRLHSVISVVLALVFLGFMVLQFNDPDPLTWVLAYGYMVVLLMLNVWFKLPKMASLLPMVIALVGAFLLWPDEYQGLTDKMEGNPAVELARESLGLVICAVACLYVFVRSWMKKPENPWVTE